MIKKITSLSGHKGLFTPNTNKHLWVQMVVIIMTEACRDLLGVAPTAATWRRHTQRYLSVNSGIKVFKKCTLSHFYRSFVCYDFVSKAHSLLDFGLNHFFIYLNITFNIIQRRLRSWTPISQLTKSQKTTDENTSPSQASFYYHEILKHNSMSAVIHSQLEGC